MFPPSTCTSIPYLVFHRDPSKVIELALYLISREYYIPNGNIVVAKVLQLLDELHGVKPAIFLRRWLAAGERKQSYFTLLLQKYAEQNPSVMVAHHLAGVALQLSKRRVLPEMAAHYYEKAAFLGSHFAMEMLAALCSVYDVQETERWARRAIHYGNTANGAFLLSFLCRFQCEANYLDILDAWLSLRDCPFGYECHYPRYERYPALQVCVHFAL